MHVHSKDNLQGVSQNYILCSLQIINSIFEWFFLEILLREYGYNHAHALRGQLTQIGLEFFMDGFHWNGVVHLKQVEGSEIAET